MHGSVFQCICVVFLILSLYVLCIVVNVLTELHVHAELDIAMEVIVMLTGEIKIG